MLTRLVREFLVDGRGTVATIFSLSLVPIMIVMGSSFEYARAIEAKSRLQAAADAAALAGMQASTAQRNDIAAGVAQANLAGQSAMLGDISSTWSTDGSGAFTGVVSATYHTTFLGVASIFNLAIHASSGAAIASGASAGSSGVCLLVLDPASSQSLLVNSGVTINGTNCEIDVASTAAPAAIFNSNDTFNTRRICVAGTNTIQNGGSVTGLVTGCATPANPFASSLPSVTVGACAVRDQNYSGSNTLNPGVYCGNFNFNGTGTLNLRPGLYVFSNTRWNLNSGWTVNGVGVTLYFADSNSYVQVNSGVAMNMSAPTSGTYAGILLFEPNGLAKTSYTINGSAGHALSGLIYQPSRNITFNAQSNLDSESVTIVVNQLILNSLTWNIAPATGFVIAPAGTTSGSSGGVARLIQ